MMAKAPKTSASGETAAAAPEETPGTFHTIQRNVLNALGRPPGLYNVVVRPLWGNRYRVNVLIGPEATVVQTLHSYFIEVDDQGELTSASPPILRIYS